ncbi:MAG: NAD-dependent epimerase/dehydratase family protein, partial [Pseudobdellovibrionaceae bacterium]
ITNLKGPILVIGASGFIGANLFRQIFQYRKDCYAVISQAPAWRLEGIPQENIIVVDLLVPSNQSELINNLNPLTLFDCAAYGAYSFQNDSDIIYKTNFNRVAHLVKILSERTGVVYIHAGSSSEYGDLSAAPVEDSFLSCNSEYSVSKAAASHLLWYYGQKKKLACAHLRLYSAYGPFEDASRLIPTLIMEGLKGQFPPFVNPLVSRDFIYVDDICDAFYETAANIKEKYFGHSFNVGSDVKTTIAELANVAKEIFQIKAEPKFSSLENRTWDVEDWYADSRKIQSIIGWQAKTDFHSGFLKTLGWIRSLENQETYKKLSKKNILDTHNSVTAIIACYKDGQAIPIMYDRLVKTFLKIGIDYEIIFVNDCSPDNSEDVIREISSQNHRVVGISHSRNFGSQAAFRSGMEIASKNSCVLLDGDLQDPPELIELFHEKWKQGYDVVYGRRVKREGPLYMQIAYRLFYYLFDRLSYINIPRDAGDFSLIDRRVVRQMLRFGERDLFLRGIRAYAGFKQTGVDYLRPERKFGRSTNNLFKNIGWAKKGILSFSNTPLNMLSLFSTFMFIISVILMAFQTISKYLYPDSAPKGVSTILIVLFLFGSLNLLAISFIGEYLAKVFEEVKQRPHFIRRTFILNGQIRMASEEVNSLKD